MKRRLIAGVLTVLGVFALPTMIGRPSPVVYAQGCGLRYVAVADDIPAGHDVSESERYPNHLMEDHLKKWGAWCEFDQAQNGTTSSTYITGGQQAQLVNFRPDLITLTVGEQNNTIVNLV